MTPTTHGICWLRSATAPPWCPGQVDVAAKTDEIPMFSQLIDHIGGLEEVVITADALHAQRAHADYPVVECFAHYLLTVKRNQPGLHAQLKALSW